MNHPVDLDPELETWMRQEPIGPVRPEVVRSALEQARALAQHRPVPHGWRRAADRSRALGWAVRAGALGAIALAAILVLDGLAPGPRLGVGDAGPSGSPSASRVPNPVVTGPPLGLAIVGLDGLVRQDLGLPRDAWMADLFPDGTRVLFLTGDDSISECGGCGVPRRPAIVALGDVTGSYVRASDGGSAELPTEHLERPVFSPDGSMIAFEIETGMDRNRDIYAGVIRPLERGPWSTNTRIVDLVRLTDDPGVDASPAWSPDGATIYYTNSGDEPVDEAGFSPTQELWSVPATGGTPVRLTDDHGADAMPDVRADGRLAWWHEGEIWSMEPDGSDRRMLVPIGGAALLAPVWSPDGSRLALLRQDFSGLAPAQPELGRDQELPLRQVVVADLGTGEITGLGHRVLGDVNPVSWMPDGSALLINRYDGGIER